MTKGIKIKLMISTIVCFIIFSPSVNGQSYNFKNFGTENNLPDPYIYALSQDVNGFLWISTGTGLSKYDGFNFYDIAFPDSVSTRIGTSLFRDTSGRLWIGCNDGSLFYTQNNALIQLPDQNIQSINDIFEGQDGFIYVVPQDKMIIKINKNSPSEIVRYYLTFDKSMTTACLLPEGELLIGTQENLLLCDLVGDSIKIRETLPGIEYSKIQVINKIRGQSYYLIGTESSGLFRLSLPGGKPVITRFKGNPELETLNIRSAFEAEDGSLWISTNSGIRQLKLSPDGSRIDYLNTFNKSSGLLAEDVKTVYQDIDGNIWMGFYGEGLSLLNSYAFSHYMPGTNPDENNIIYIAQEKNLYLLFTNTGYYLFDLSTGRSESFINFTGLLGGNDISCYYHEKDNSLWIGTKGGGLYLRSPNGSVRPFFRSGNSGENTIKNIKSDSKYIWLSTIDGVLIVDKTTGTLKAKFKKADRLPHNSINEVYLRKDGSALAATECDSMRLYSIDPDRGVSIGNNAYYSGSKVKVLCFSENKEGEIWAGTYGNGVFYFKGDSVVNLTTSDGLSNNYCYSILADSHGKIWLGHVRSFSRYDTETGTMKVYSTDFAKGGDCNQNSLFESTDGKILIGTTEGLIVYDRERDQKSITIPINNIISVIINNKKYPYQPNYSLSYGKYDIVINYVGINLGDPSKVYYSTRLENWADKWTDFRQNREVTYNQVRDGKYKFMLRSINEDSLSQEEPLSFDLYIKKPFWRTWWFIISSILLSVGILVIIIKEREKAQARIKEYLETELAERTRLVLKQKDEIELQNIEITDSINYAKRIQSSILPDINKLKENFRDAFIIFHPRDIVSGDFYWFDKINDDKFLLVCADSTGHGVPGAFMSMIGSTLLQDIISRKGITRPAEILSLLDKQIFTTLNQNIDVGVSNDGMDMVVCEFNTRTRHIRFASAMRPVIIVMGGESYYIKGNRCSIGGESAIEKYFDDQEYYLNDGDTIYLFSDGLPDQFGGDDGKKMKIARLKKLLDVVSKLPMNEQKETISNFFFDWKGDYEQVDDILLIGIKV